MNVALRTLAAVCVLALAGAAPTRAAGNDDGLTVPAGFRVEVIAHVPRARELAAAPDGSLFVGTLGSDVMVVRDAEGNPKPPESFVHIDEAPAAGVALTEGALYVGTRYGVWRVERARDGRAEGKPVKIASVRPGNGGDHITTTVAIEGSKLYAGVGSSCNACTESDPTRATVQEMTLDGLDMHAKAVHIRNPIALAVDATGTLWAGVAGQDELEHGHPYEMFDPVSRHDGTPDYGWPVCYENHRRAHGDDVDCAHQTVARVVFPAYETPIGAVFYPTRALGRYAFPEAYRGGAFVTLHGSWHEPPVPPRVVFVPMRGGEPATAVDWSDPDKQWRQFLGGFQRPDGSRTGRPTGVAVGSEGSLFVADDSAGVIYRIRPLRG